LAAAVCQLEAVGMDLVAQHEADLTAYALARLLRIPGIHVFGDTDPQQAVSRLGVIPLLMEGVPHFLLAAVLSYEFGIGVRNGCFCAHPYLLHLLGVGEVEAQRVRHNILRGDRREVPGLVRVSFGLYNQIAEIDYLAEALECIQRGDYRGDYVQDAASGDFYPRGWQVDYDDFFSVKKFLS
jgi:cysteine desulfurase / selenocysteine lyase